MKGSSESDKARGNALASPSSGDSSRRPAVSVGHDRSQVIGLRRLAGANRRSKVPWQLVLVDRLDTGTGNFDIEYRYAQIQWETGDFSGGSGGLGGQSARVGYTAGTALPVRSPSWRGRA
jgi:hypothetical protein